MPKRPECDPHDIALKSFFLGPQAENGSWVSGFTLELLDGWFQWRKSLFPHDGFAISHDNQLTTEFTDQRERFQNAVRDILSRYEKEIPKFSPRYLGHMVSEISLPAFFGHLITLFHNPNNVSREASIVGAEIESEAIRILLELVGYSSSQGFGHFTSGGTVANFESLLRAQIRLKRWARIGHSGDSPFKRAHQGWESYHSHQKNGAKDQRFLMSEPVVLIPENKHYSWKKGVNLIGLPESSYWPIGVDSQGRLSVTHLNELIQKARTQEQPILMVVSVAGTTELGTIDPIHRIQDTLDHFAEHDGLHIWHHIDGAYGAYFNALGPKLGPETIGAENWNAISSISRANSITLDPHKLGYVPYACGAFLTANLDDYCVPPPDVPYVQFRDSLDRGQHTLEGSRSAAGATATWLTHHCMGLNPEGYGRLLSRTIKMKQALAQTLAKSVPSIRIAPGGDTNILCFHVADDGQRTSQSNKRVLDFCNKMAENTHRPIFVGHTTLGPQYRELIAAMTKEWNAVLDTSDLNLVRVVMLNPFFDSKEMKVDFFEEFLDRARDSI